MSHAPLTDRQKEVLTELTRYIEAHGFAPTLKELCDALGLASHYTVVCHLRALEKKGVIEMTCARQRNIRVVGHSPPLATAPEEPRAREPLSARQREVLDAILALKLDGITPTLREIASQLGGVRTATVSCHLHTLRAKGWIDWQDGKRGTVQVLGGFS